MKSVSPYKPIFLYLIFLISFTSDGQKSPVDSLQGIVSRHPRDTVGIKALVSLAVEFARKDLSKSRNVLYRAIDLANALNTICGLSGCYSQLTTSHQSEGRPDSAQYYLDKLASLALANPSIVSIGANYNMTAGLFYKNKGEFDVALPFMLKALDYMTAPENQINRAGQLLNIGNTYLSQGDIRKAADYHLQSLKLFEILGNKRGQSFCLQSLGNDFIKLKRFEESQKYYEQSLALKEEIHDVRGMISSWGGLGNVYMELGKYQEAQKLYERSLVRARELKLTFDESVALYEIGVLHKKMKRQREARSAFGASLKLARQRGDSLLSAKIAVEISALEEKTGKPDVENSLVQKIQIADQVGDQSAKADAYLNMAEWNYKHRKFEKAYDMLKHYHQLNDSLHGEEVIIQLKKAEESYQNEKNEKEIALLKKNQELREAIISRQNARQQIIIVALVSILLIAGVLFNHFRVINRSKRLVEIEKVRNNIARDLHDDMGSALSSIHIMSQLAMKEAGQSNHHLQRISENTARMMESMSDIVWSINPENDSLEKMVMKMKEFAAEILEPKNIRYRFVEDTRLNNVTLDVEQRKNLFLIFKESINNAAKYSEGTEVIISIRMQNNALQLSVRDNGKGFDKARVRNGNGLANMTERARMLKGTLIQFSEPGKGTEIVAELPVT